LTSLQGPSKYLFHQVEFRQEKSRDGRLPEKSLSENGLISAFVLIAAFLLCFSLAACPARASENDFQEKYNLPKSPDTLLKEILSRPEFQEDETQSFIDRQLERLYRELARLFARILKSLPAVESPQIDERVGRTIIKMILVGAAGLLVLYVLARVFSLVAKRRLFSDTDSQTPEPGKHGLTGSRNSWDHALMLAEKADYGEALINLFRFAVLKLDEQGILLFHSRKTNREILESIKSDPLREIVGEMVPSFNRVRYGEASCDRLEYEHFLGLCRRLAGRV
jgi:hypothetical protein